MSPLTIVKILAQPGLCFITQINHLPILFCPEKRSGSDWQNPSKIWCSAKENLEASWADRSTSSV